MLECRLWAQCCNACAVEVVELNHETANAVCAECCCLNPSAVSLNVHACEVICLWSEFSATIVAKLRVHALLVELAL